MESDPTEWALEVGNDIMGGDCYWEDGESVQKEWPETDESNAVWGILKIILFSIYLQLYRIHTDMCTYTHLWMP